MSNLVGYVIIEYWRGESPGLIGLPNPDRAHVQEVLDEMRAVRGARDSVRTWELGEVWSANKPVWDDAAASRSRWKYENDATAGNQWS